MKEAEIKVPKELSDVIARALQVTQVQNYLERADAIAKAVLSWQREHPPVPNDEQRLQMVRMFTGAKKDNLFIKMLDWWIRHMYDAPAEPEVPEAIGEMQKIHLPSVHDQADLDRLVTALICEAYARGLKGRK